MSRLTGEQLGEWLQSRNITQEQFAKIAPVPIGTLRNWIQGRSPIPLYFQRVLSNVDYERAWVKSMEKSLEIGRRAKRAKQ